MQTDIGLSKCIPTVQESDYNQGMCAACLFILYKSFLDLIMKRKNDVRTLLKNADTENSLRNLSELYIYQIFRHELVFFGEGVWHKRNKTCPHIGRLSHSNFNNPNDAWLD